MREGGRAFVSGHLPPPFKVGPLALNCHLRTEGSDFMLTAQATRLQGTRAAVPVISLQTFHFCDGVIERANTPLHTL